MDVYKYLRKRLGTPENWDKYDYETQRYSFDDMAEVLHEVVNKNAVLPDVSGSLLIEKCKLIETTDYSINCEVTECCNIGPIVNENYCPKCGKMIIRNER